MSVWDDRPCTLGEGPLWHPRRQQLFWFDILERRLLTQEAGRQRSFDFDETVTAAGWVDDTRLLVASETRLLLLDLETGARDDVVPLEAGDARTRSNDGRADPFGGFWIGTMGKAAEPRLGAIYRYFGGELRQVAGGVTISNAICFAPDGSCAYWADTSARAIRRQKLDADGWPAGEAEPFIDLALEGLKPDGAVTDAAGNIWNAQWGAGRVACYGADGAFRRAVDLPARQTTCPAFGGADLTTLFCTSARTGLDADLLAREPQQGMTFAVEGVAQGRPEPQVVL